ncbi:MAG: protein translocase subunit SecF [Fusobacterium sp.]|uniref:protein translocase subunit SecF n=1 Tax=Fusobacterium sp. TaxID=68766 RepID=UPI0026DABBB2|nr:protein translocase subunit SecF [Fusobacterium sp.]MDO4690710.1 protein translocase subunit SecF [Fusobacterium sp.]
MRIDLKVIERMKPYLSISVVLVILSLGIFLFKGLNYGIDFVGGNLIQINYVEKNITLNEINENLDELAEKIPQINPNSRKVQISDDGTIIIRVQEITENQKEEILENLKKLGNYDLEKAEKVGASVGADLKKSAIYSLVIGSILIVAYVTMRFEFSFAIAAIIALLHDIIISIGYISLVGYEINTPFIAAILTILGYSINDTIVIFDRIRENLRRMKANKWTLEECMTKSVDQVMVRSINTSVTTLFSIIAVLIFGGDSLKTFIVTMLVGILAGSYSSIFLATPLVYILNKRKNRDMGDYFKEKEEEEERVEKILV